MKDEQKAAPQVCAETPAKPATQVEGLTRPVGAAPCVVNATQYEAAIMDLRWSYGSIAEDYAKQFCAALERVSTPSAVPAAASAVPDADCLTCHGDPAMCASVPGLRHCEKANREEQVPAGCVVGTPVAWRYKYGIDGEWRYVDVEDLCNDLPGYYREPLYRAPSAVPAEKTP